MASFDKGVQPNNMNLELAAAAAAEADEEMLTVVTNSPAPSEHQFDTATLPQLFSDGGFPAIGACKNRAAGRVCICDLCEAQRTRLLHQCSTAHPSKKKRTRGTGGDQEESAPSAEVAVASSGLLPVLPKDAKDEEANKLATMSAACKTILQCIGEDPEREGLLKTPDRWAKALLFMCHGYHLTPADVTNGAVFSENHDEMVVVRNIDIHSLCEHHMVPFTGRVHIGYIPNGQILGLSKLARIAELYARRLQVQERLTRQIADAVVETIAPLGVAVVIECTHFCMVMRGVQKVGAVTTTSSVRGCFETNPKTRAEFFSILHGGAKPC